MKIHLALLCLGLAQHVAFAQTSPASPSTSVSPGASSPAVNDRTEIMLRRLREAMTNPPAPSNGAASGASVPAESRKTVDQATPAAVPAVSQPVAQSRAVPVNPVPAPQVSPAPVFEVPGRSPSPTNLPPNMNGAPVVGANPPVRPNAAQLPTPRTIPQRNPNVVAGPPGFNPAPPGPGLPAPGLGGPGLPGAVVPPPVGGFPAPDVNPNAGAIAGALNPNEIIQAGTIQIQGMEPDQFFDIYSQVSGRTVLRPYTLPLQKVTLKAATDWTRQEAVFAMDSVLAQNNVAMIPIGDKFVKAVPKELAATEGAPPSKVKPTNYAESEPFITQVIKLDNVKPTEVQQLLSSFTKSPQGITAFDATQTIVIRDYASNVKRMLEVIQTVDITPKEPDYKLEAIPIKYGKVIDLYNTMQSLIAGGGAASGSAVGQQGSGQYGRMGNSGRFGGSGGGRYGGYGNSYGGGGYGGGYGSSYGGSSYGRSYGGYGSGGYSPYEESIERLSPMQTATPSPTATRTGSSTSVGGAQNSFQNRLNQIVRRAASGSTEEVQVLEDARIVPDERSNKLLVFANKRDMEMITNIISKVDVLLAQVLIEAVILEVNLGDSYKLGVSWAQQPKSFGNGSSGAGVLNNGPGFLNSVTNFPSSSPSGLSYFGTLANDWSVAIQALADDSSIHVVSRPRIQTTHALPGTFFVGETVPYITGFTDYPGYVGSSGLTTSSVIQQANVGFSLFVTPFITPEGLVYMEISQEFSTRGEDKIINNNPIPIINGRNAESTLTVRDGDTIMMGGFITENRSQSKSGVPFLKDIPGLGALFRSRNDSSHRTELIVLMRARVLRTPDEAAIVASQEKAELPGIRQAERDLKKADQKRKKKAAKQDQD